MNRNTITERRRALQKIIDVMKKQVTKRCIWDDAKCRRKIDCDECSFNKSMMRDYNAPFHFMESLDEDWD